MSPRLPALADGQLAPAAAATLAAVQRTLGITPNLHRTLAASPAALESYTAMAGALARGVLGPALRERIALAVAARNGCRYCASAHTALGKGAGLDEAELVRAQHGTSSDPQAAAALFLVDELVAHRGRVPDVAIQAARDAGLGDAELVEIAAHVGMNQFTNLFNEFARTDIDFPVVELVH